MIQNTCRRHIKKLTKYRHLALVNIYEIEVIEKINLKVWGFEN